MTVTTMNHFTVLSDDLEETRRFYCDLFGFKVGWRPPFQFPGWWLYAADGDTPILHVIHRDPLPKERAGVLDHMAFSAKDLPGTVATLKREGIEYELRRLPGRRDLAAVLQRSARRQGRVRLRQGRAGTRRPRRGLI